MNVSNAMHQVMKACQCDSKAVPPDQLQVGEETLNNKIKDFVVN